MKWHSWRKATGKGTETNRRQGYSRLDYSKRKCVYVEEILLFNKFSQVSIHALTTKIYVVAQQSCVMVGRWWIFGEFLWPPYGIEQAIIFLPWFLFFLSKFQLVNFMVALLHGTVVVGIIQTLRR